MIIIRAILLGILQSLTEFFPLSNTSHILLLQNLFHYKKSYAAYDVVIDAGTLLALCIYFAKDIQKIIWEAPIALKSLFVKNKGNLFLEYPYALTFSFLVFSSIATGAFRVAFREAGEAAYQWLPILGVSWIVMGWILFYSLRFEGGSRNIYEMNHQDAFWIGLAQGTCLLPGISRIGICICAAMALGMNRKEAARYSFLLGIPYITAAIVYKLSTGAHFYQSDQAALLVSFLVSALAGVGILYVAMQVIQKGKYSLFGFYCIAIGIFTLGYSFFQRTS